MKINTNFSFAKLLITYILIVLFIGFLLIMLTLTNFLEQFVLHTAYHQSHTAAANMMHGFEREIRKIEHIPVQLTENEGIPDEIQLRKLPLQVMKSYSMLVGCAVYYPSANPEAKAYTVAWRTSGAPLQTFQGQLRRDLLYPDPEQIIRKNQQQGYWIYSHIDKCKTLAYCQPLCDNNRNSYALLKIDFPLTTITDLICDHRLFDSGDFFILDKDCHCVTHTGPSGNDPVLLLADEYDSDNKALFYSIKQGETGCLTLKINHIKHYIYYTPIPMMNWRLGIICPYHKILYSAHKLYYLLYSCLGLGLLLLFLCIINIVRRLSSPLKILAQSTRQIAEGQFNFELTTPNASKEIRELYDSFHHMQQSLRDYIEKLQITTAEKEKMNSEMNLARQIQQRFLPQHPSLPSNIELIAELRQSREIGGDLYEFFQVDNRLYFTIGDVSGKGAPAALYMASVCKLFHYVASCHTSTATICDIINQHMWDDIEGDMYITMFMGILDINTGILTYTDAGHPYPLIIYENGDIHILETNADMPIAIQKDHHYSEHTCTFRKGMSLLLYTDGVTDAENAAGQFYGKNRMLATLQAIPEKTPANMLKILLADLRKHMGKQNPSDDLTLLIIRYKGLPGRDYRITDDSYPD